MGSKKSKITISSVAFVTIIIAAVLYLAQMLFSQFGLDLKLFAVLKDAAQAVIIIVATVLGWGYAMKKGVAWRILYLICFIIILICIVLPLLK